MAAEWRDLVSKLVLSQEQAASESVLDRLNSLVYPLPGIQMQKVEDLIQHVCKLRAPALIVKCSKLFHSLVEIQKLSLKPEPAFQLFTFLCSTLSYCSDPTEPLYALSALAPLANPSNMLVEELLDERGTLVTIATSSKSIPPQRAALQLISSLTTQLPEDSSLSLSALLEVIVDTIHSKFSSHDNESVLYLKLHCSLLKTVCCLLGRVTSLQPLPLLPSLLSALKVHITLGLPGHQRTPSVPVLPNPHTIVVNTGWQASSVAGPRHHRHRGGKARKELNAGGGNRRVRDMPSVPQRERTGEGVGNRRVVGDWADLSGVSSGNSDSDSDVSEGGSSSSTRLVKSKIRQQALVCMAGILQSLDNQVAFSYGLPFLPDSPRGPASPPTLLTCITKDPYSKCRRAAIGVVAEFLEGSKPYLAAADDRVSIARPYTPYSNLLGGVVRELHHCLLLAISAEQHARTLQHTIKCLGVLVANSPYPHLSEQYLTRVCSVLKPLVTHSDTGVAVGCLTCLGAVVSAYPPLPEVERWLYQEEQPWVLEHCLILLRSHASAALQIEALQVLTALVKFYFHVIHSCWKSVGALYSAHLCKCQEPLQIHALRLLEEVGRSLSSLQPISKDESAAAVQWWEELLSGPLIHWLQPTSSASPPYPQACSVLATIGNAYFSSLKRTTRIVVLTLLLALSKDHNTSVRANAVRGLGVLSQYACLKADVGFMADTTESVQKALSVEVPLVVRVQAGWALGNVTEVVSNCSDLSFLLSGISSVVLGALRDNDKVRVNVVRAAGHLVKGLSGSNIHLLPDICELLSKAVVSGSMKTRWNACYACHNALSNDFFVEHSSDNMKVLVDALCTTLTTCKNCKVRTNAALALGTPAHYGGSVQLLQVWEALVVGLQGSEAQADFADYRQAKVLKSEICLALCQVLCNMTEEVLSSVPPPIPLLSTELTTYVSTLCQEQQPAVSDKHKGQPKEVLTKAVTRLTDLAQNMSEGSSSLLFCSEMLENLKLSSPTSTPSPPCFDHVS